MIYCPGCGTANRDGSRFCNECGVKLPTMTSALCPTCHTPNPPHSLFCEKCGTRLIASLPEEQEEAELPASATLPKGLSLPTKSDTGSPQPPAAKPSTETPPAQPSDAASSVEDLPDWMQVVQSALANTADLNPPLSDAATVLTSSDEVPGWLQEMTSVSGASEEQPAVDQALPEWAQRLRDQPESSAAEAAAEELPDWLQTLGSTGRLPAAETAPEAVELSSMLPETPIVPPTPAAVDQPSAEAEEIPDWLKEVPLPEQPLVPAEPPVRAEQPPAAEEPDWLRELRPAVRAEEDLPDWLDELGIEEAPTEEASSASMALSTGDSALDWLSQLGATAAAELPASGDEEEAELESAPIELPAPTDWFSTLRAAQPEMEAEQGEEEALPDWMSAVGGAAPSAIGEPAAYEEEVPAWLRETGTAQQEQTPEVEVPSEVQGEEEGVPDWLKGAGGVAAGAALAGAFAAEPEPAPTTPKAPTDWLSALRAAQPEMEAEQGEEEAQPEWMSAVDGAAPSATGEPAAYEEEVPAWLRETGTAQQEPTPEAEVPSEVQGEEEGVPDWLKGAGGVAAGAALAGAFAMEPEPEPATPKAPTDWLSALRAAQPEMEAEQGEEEAQPEWMSAEDGAAPSAAGGPAAYEQEIPDWLRETGTGYQELKAETEVPPDSQAEEGLPDWLKGAGVGLAAAAAVGAALDRSQEPAAEADIPDWLREEPVQTAPVADLGEVPDWLREEPVQLAVATETGEFPEWLRAEPATTVSVETPAEEPEAAEEDWLRELAPAAALTGAAAFAQAESEELEEAEELEEVEEPEEPASASWVSAVAPVAAAGMATAAMVRKSEDEPAEPAAEMPEWLKELRQEQQAGRAVAPTSSVVTPAESQLTQAEIPAWLEALRPTEKAAEEEEEEKTETAGPLAGLANVLPPAPFMGELQSGPARLAFETSAEDLARAGVLRELLGQQAIAAASVEEFVVKSAPIRRRVVRWVVAAVLLAALLIPARIDLNAVTGIPLLPRIEDMVVPPVTSSAAYQWSLLQAGARVLVVFDYDASQAGEMNQVAGVILQSLQARQADIEVASLNPQGLSFAQEVWKQLPNTDGTPLPEVGISPAQANGVQNLLARAGDVNLIINLAASADTVRWWVEQTALNHSQIPLVAGVSLGAEQLVMPYVQSGQVKGLISGYPGALAYAKVTGLMNLYTPDTKFKDQIQLDGQVLAHYALAVLIFISLLLALLPGGGKRSRS